MSRQDYVEIAKNLLAETKEPEVLLRCFQFMFSCKEISAALVIVNDREALKSIVECLDQEFDLEGDQQGYFMSSLWSCEDREMCKYMLSKSNMIEHLPYQHLVYEKHAVYKNVWKDCLELVKSEVNRRTHISREAVQYALDRINKLLQA